MKEVDELTPERDPKEELLLDPLPPEENPKLDPTELLPLLDPKLLLAPLVYEFWAPVDTDPE